jgi:hypothetical protein
MVSQPAKKRKKKKRGGRTVRIYNQDAAMARKEQRKLNLSAGLPTALCLQLRDLCAQIFILFL